MSCACETRIINTGSGCAPKVEIGSQLIFVNTYKADGTRNYIATQVNAVVAERWMPSLGLDLVTDVAGDNITQDLGAGKTVKVADGTDAFAGSMVGSLATNILFGEFSKLECEEISAYIITEDGALQGVEYSNDFTKFYPIRIQNGSLGFKFMKGNVNTPNVQQIDITFNWARIEDAKDIRVIKESEMTDPVFGLKGLVSVNGAVSAISTTSFRVQMTSNFGSGITNTAVEGLVTGDLTLTELTPTPGAVASVVVAESATVPGFYVVTFTAETTGDVLQQLWAKDGFEFTNVTAVTVTIP
jgi:hypothetical protein